MVYEAWTDHEWGVYTQKLETQKAPELPTLSTERVCGRKIENKNKASQQGAPQKPTLGRNSQK